MKTRLTNLKRISNRQHPSAALAAGDIAFFALGQILHDRAFSAAAFLFEPVLVDDLVKTVGELVVEVELAVIRFVFLQPQLGAGAFVRVFQAFVRRVILAVAQPLQDNLMILDIDRTADHAVENPFVIESVDIVSVAFCLRIKA